MDSSKKWKKQSDGKVVINYVFDGKNQLINIDSNIQG